MVTDAELKHLSALYSEPSCTPSRAAVMTGRHAVRNGMYNVGVAYEFGGLAADEVTLAEVLGKEGYATAFYGKSHLGDVESSYLTNQGFDDALWSPYNQIPSLYTPATEKNYGIAPTSLRPELFPKDPKDIDFQAALNKGSRRESGGQMGGSHVLMADGAVLFFTDSIEPDLHEALFTKTGKENIGELFTRFLFQ
jgi:arylsulfatase A-like enzyme